MWLELTTDDHGKTLINMDRVCLIAPSKTGGTTTLQFTEKENYVCVTETREVIRNMIAYEEEKGD